MKQILWILCMTVCTTFGSSLANAEEHEWTNRQGVTIKAVYISSTKDSVTLSIQGKTYVVKLADLNNESQELVAKLNAPRRATELEKLQDSKRIEVVKRQLATEWTMEKRNFDAVTTAATPPDKTHVRDGLIYHAENAFTPLTGWVGPLYTGRHLKESVSEYSHYKDGRLDLHYESSVHPGLFELLIRTEYKDGKEDGLTTMYSKGHKTFSGHKSDETTYKNGKENGPSTGWWGNGRKKTEGHNKDGKKSGLWRYWRENGQKQLEGTFTNGVGTWTVWDRKGQVKGTGKGGLTEWNEAKRKFRF